MKQKLVVYEMFKKYQVMDVSDSCFDNSDKIETAGFMTCFKIFSDDDLKFRIDYLKSLNFTEGDFDAK